jgi:hypothetical protein
MHPLLLSLALLATPAFAEGVPTPSVLGEIELPSFHRAALAADEPVQDLLLEPTGTVWLLGKASVWRWAAPGKSLKRLKLGKPDVAEQDHLAHLGFDGLSLFAAGDGALYQVQWAQGRVFRYPLTPRAETFGFAGQGDDFWLLQAASLFQFDRYGKVLRPKGDTLRLAPSDKPLYDAKTKTLWIAHQNQLQKSRLDGVPPVTTLTASHPLLGIARGDGELILHTAHTVLRVGLNGKLKASIPVEGKRTLVAMDVTPEAHAYLFDDDVLEIYDVTAQSVASYRLPLDGASEVKSLTLRGAYVALLADGRPRLFGR